MKQGLSRIILVIALIIGLGMTSVQAQVVIKDMRSKMPVTKDVKIGKLDNGITYFIRQNKSPEKRAELQIVLKAGSVDEDDDQKGLAHFIEHMCFNGTKNFPKNDLIKFLESTGMRFGADVNANTGFDRIWYMIQVPTENADTLEKGLQIIEDWAHNVSFDPVEIEKERGVIMEEWRMHRGAMERVQRQTLPMMLWNSKFAERLPIGDTNIILHAPREKFLRYYNDWFRPEKMAIIAVGDFDPAQMEQMIIKHFSNIPKSVNARKQEYYPIPEHQDTKIVIVKDKELPMVNATVMFKHKGYDESTFEAYRKGIVNGLASTMINERLSDLSRKPNTPFMYAGVEESRFIGDMRGTFLIAVPKADNVLGGFEAMLTEAFRAAQHGFTPSELDRAKKDLMKDMEKAYNERSKNASQSYAAEIMRYFYQNEGMPGVEYELGLYKKFMPEITLDEVNNYYKDIMQIKNTVITLSAPDNDKTKVPTNDELLASFNKMANSKYEAYKDVAINEPLMKEIPVSGKIVKEKNLKGLDAKELTLSNGAKVVYKKTNFKDDEIVFRAFSYGGTDYASDELFHTATVTDDIVRECGVRKFDASALEKILTGKIVNLSPIIGNNYEGFNGATTPADLESFMQLLNLYFTSPRKDKDAFESLKEKLKETIINSKKDPHQVLKDSINAIMGSYNYRVIPTSEEDLNNVDLNKAIAFYKERFADASNFTFFFVGNFDEKKLKELAETYIATLPAKHVETPIKDMGIETPKGVINRAFYKGQEPQSTIVLTLHGDFDYNSDNIYKIRAMVEVLSIRLREEIREEKGGAYSIGAYPKLEKYPKGAYKIMISFTTDPTRVDELISRIKEVIAEVREGRTNPDYIKKVKEIQKREFEVSMKKNEFWLANLYSMYFNHGDENSILKYMDRLNSYGEKDLDEAAAKYLKMDNFVSFVLYPENMKK